MAFLVLHDKNCLPVTATAMVEGTILTLAPAKPLKP
jgi:hypothetical protein